MSRCGRLVLAALCCSLVLRLAGSEGSAESDGDAMARAALPPPPKSAQTGADRYQPPQAQTLAARRESTASGPATMGPGSPHKHTSKHQSREIAAVDPAMTVSKRPLARSGHHKRRHLDGADLAARDEKPHDRQTGSSVMHAQAYDGSRDAKTPEPPIAVPLPPFGYYPAPPPGYAYPSIYQPPWLPGPTPPR
jgi:hypothetical protein